MIFDITNLFGEAQAITADAASTNVIDLGATGTPVGASTPIVRDIGRGKKIPLSLTVNETFNNLTSLTVSIQCDNDSAFGSPKTVATATYLLAELTAGKQLSFPDDIPEGVNERYLRIYYDVTGTNPSTGKITAGVVAGRPSNFVGGQ
ncbi:Bbp16 family capsid cement protein [Sphingopyxis macrogoltabida]|uniref:Uncharacterized protein n=1 Tax=Sphingopyxis macrogoltabida TaxID=33050 RepID=A0A0N9V0W0_SPHMC|nr:hypothetical protein [Sphingopyxis macrogoltabida]ALH82909.1 hypothetical protein AN936_21890 [Sphingopyxis macrogoltabida]